MTNTHGEVLAPVSVSMEAYDRLPQPVRRVISEAPFPYATTHLEEVWLSSKGKFRTEAEAADAFAAFITHDFTSKLARAGQ